MKSASNSFSMLNSKYQFNNTKRYTHNNNCLITDCNVKSNASSQDYQLITSPSSSSSIGKQSNKNNNSLRNIKMYYSEISNHLKKENQSQLSESNHPNIIKVNSNINKADNGTSGSNMQNYCENVSFKDNKGLNQLQPSTKATKESTDNSMKANNQTSPSSYFNMYTNLNMNKNSRTNEINTPEELHYFYVNILQNGKEIEINFDKKTTETD